MNPLPVTSAAPVTLVGGAPFAPADLAEARRHGPLVVAADGGAAAALAAGAVPRAVIGDLDSLPPAIRAALPPGRVHHIAEQDSTDFDKCLRNIDAPLVLGVGLTGGRIDHQMAAQSTLLHHADRRCLLIGAQDVMFLCPPALALDVAPGSRVSLYPVAPGGGRSRGLHWPIDGIAFDPAGPVGTSNRATGPVHLAMDGPTMLVVLERGALAAAVTALAAQSASWPARA